MTIYLGLTFEDQRLLTLPTNLRAAIMAPMELLAYLETFYALGAPNVNRTALRTEQYRQVITAHLTEATEPFYAAAFRADQSATAEELLSRRDELLDAGYRLDQAAIPETPARITVLHELEALLLDACNELDLLPGQADRLNLLLAALEEDRHPRLEIHLNEPWALLPPGLQRLLLALEALGDSVRQLSSPEAPAANNDLGRWQTHLQAGNALDEPLRGDGSLLLLKAERETHIAAYLARLLRDNPDWRPGILLPTRNQTLDNSLVAEGLPSLGIPSASLARPSLQVLKLITTFLWDPIEVERVMEFVSLATKPLDRRLSRKIALHLADTPGLFSGRWFAAVESVFEEMQALVDDPQRTRWDKARLDRERSRYNILFRRKNRRYSRDGAVPKWELRDLFTLLKEWAPQEREDRRAKDLLRQSRDPEGRDRVGEYISLLTLAAQAQRALELLDALPETDLTFLEVERLVRTVYEPAPTTFQPEEQGSLPTVFAPASAPQSFSRLIWWDFVERDSDYFFSRHYPEELAFLAERGITLTGPDRQNALVSWQQLRPVLHARDQLVLCLPARTDGSEADPHPLLGDLEAAFPEGSLARITVNIDAAGAASALGKLHPPAYAPVPIQPLDRPVPHLQIDRMRTAAEREHESPTALEDLLYYPHKWVFRHQLGLRGQPILSIADENRLRGNLSHLFIERLLNQIKAGKVAMQQEAVNAWITANWRDLLEKEGAVLLEYGQEPERVQFVRTMRYSAWSLVHYLKENGWRVRGSEASIRGDLETMGQAVRGRADLVLEREKNGKVEVAIVDLKWRGKSVFRNLLRNAKDVQLCLYAE
ncbi:MAG: PD-(D/E)XK nuclease family protein, partial [Bacteroidota bacterium]